MNRTLFTETYIPLQDKYYRIALRLLTSKDEARDAVQECLTRLWDQRDKLIAITNPDAYGSRVVRNYCLDRLRSKQSTEVSLQPAHDHGVNSTTTTLQRDEGIKLVRELVARLPERDRTIMHLREVEHESFEAIAIQLEMSESAVRVALSRARKNVVQQLRATYEYGL